MMNLIKWKKLMKIVLNKTKILNNLTQSSKFKPYKLKNSFSIE